MQVWARADTQVRYVMSKSKQQRSTVVDQIPCTLESVCQFCFDYGALNCVQEREMEDSRRILCGFCSAEGSTICGTNVRLRERPAGYFMLRCDSQDLTLQDILWNGVRYCQADS